MLSAEVRRAVWQAAAELAPASARPGQPQDPSTLRPGPPGTYVSTLPYLLGAGAAAVLARRLAGLPWIAAAAAADGHLAITVTDEALASLAVRIPLAPDCAASDILRGLAVPAPEPPAPPDWASARGWLAAAVTGRLAAKAGAGIFPERPGGPSPARAGVPVQAAIDYAGRDVVRYALVRGLPAQVPASVAELPVRCHLGNPAYAVRYAHAHAASTLRQAADLGLGRGEAAGFAPRLLGHPLERVLLSAMSWLPERVAWSARRGRPGEFARYLEEMAGAYHDCREHCPALPFGGHRAPPDPGTARARLWLVTAAKTAIAAGLDLLGVSAPARL